MMRRSEHKTRSRCQRQQVGASLSVAVTAPRYGTPKIADLSQQLDRASRKKDTKKVEELAQSIDELESKLDPEYPLLLDRLWNIDPTSRDAQEVLSILNKLDEFCG
jgi:hypothetical protein